MKKSLPIIIFSTVVIIVVGIVFVLISKKTPADKKTDVINQTNTTDNKAETEDKSDGENNNNANTTVNPNNEQYQKLCGWVDDSDVIIKVNFAPGVVKDSSYEAGFYLNTITSHMRLARSGCDYRTGFSYDELTKLGVVQVGVRGYTDSNRRLIKGEPINVVFNEKGIPDIGSNIEVTITN